MQIEKNCMMMAEYFYCGDDWLTIGHFSATAALIHFSDVIKWQFYAKLYQKSLAGVYYLYNIESSIESKTSNFDYTWLFMACKLCHLSGKDGVKSGKFCII